jgi:hypothetical protein
MTDLIAPCGVCGHERPPLAIEDGDPYCSADCCKLAHHVPARVPLRIGAVLQTDRGEPADDDDD